MISVLSIPATGQLLIGLCSLCVALGMFWAMDRWAAFQSRSDARKFNQLFLYVLANELSSKTKRAQR